MCESEKVVYSAIVETKIIENKEYELRLVKTDNDGSVFLKFGTFYVLEFKPNGEIRHIRYSPVCMIDEGKNGAVFAKLKR